MGRAEKVGGEQGWQEKVPQLHEQALELLQFPPLMIHVALVLIVGWIASLTKLNVLFVFTLGFAYLCYIESRQRQKVETKIRRDERKSTDRKRLLSDAETARWLNNVVESMWPIFLESFASQHFLMRLAPWFLDKYKPWTAKKVVLQHLYLGRSPPVFTMFRAGRHPTDGDHLVLEMTLNFSAATDMSAVMAVQMKKRVGLGIWTSLHISNIQVEGKLKVGVRFVKGWPVVGRLRICFSDAPIIRMVAKPVFSYGVDVTDLPGIATWLDKMIIEVLEQSLVEPNLLVVDMDKLVGDLMSVNAKLQTWKTPTSGDWFSVGKKGLVATLLVEILEAEKLKRSDPNGKADPYVKIVLGQIQYQTSIQRKTLYPSWHESFRLPIANWTQPKLVLTVLDKDRFSDDRMGYKEIAIDDIKDGQRHEMWLHLDDVKTGRLHVALTVEEIPSGGDKEKNICDSPQLESAWKDVQITPSEAVTRRDTAESAKTKSDGEALGSDCDETPIKSEFQFVDIGFGQSGCVSIEKPGRHTVKEASSTERLSQRKKAGRGLTEMERRQPDKSLRDGEELDDVQHDLTEPSPGRKSRVKKFLHRHQSQGVKKDYFEVESGNLSEDDNDLVVVGNKGTEMHTKFEVDKETENLENSSLDNENTVVPDSGELQGGDVDEVDILEKDESGRLTSRKIRGKRVMIRKTANNIGHALRKFHSVKPGHDLPQGLTESLSRDASTSLKQNMACSSDEGGALSEERGGERILLKTNSGVLNQGDQNKANEAERSGQLHNFETKADVTEAHPSKGALKPPVYTELADQADIRLQGSCQPTSPYYPDANMTKGKAVLGLQNSVEGRYPVKLSVKIPPPQMQSSQALPENILRHSFASTPPTREPPPPP